MSDDQHSKSSDSQSPRARKPGFFSRLFTAKQVDNAEERANAELREEAAAGASEQAAAPVGTDSAPDEDIVPEHEWLALAQELERQEEEKKAAGVDSPYGAGPAGFDATPTLEPGEVPTTQKTWFQRLRERLRRGSGSFLDAIRAAVGMSGKLDEETLEQIEEILIAADVGMETTMKIVDQLQRRAKEQKAEGADAIMALLREILTEMLAGNVKAFAPSDPDNPYVVMVVGVNGVGKTTTIGKMAKRCSDAGLKVMLVAGDTFRAAAIEQLEIWAGRVGAEFMKSKQGSDPSGLVFDALTAAKARGVDVVFVDTAGRLQTKSTLMAELGKIERVAQKVIPDAPHENLLVLDATTGQNALSQAQAFSAAVKVSSIAMTKLDGTAKGGILLTLRDRTNIPITLVGVGEGLNDLRDFDPDSFTKAMFGEEG